MLLKIGNYLFNENDVVYVDLENSRVCLKDGSGITIDGEIDIESLTVEKYEKIVQEMKEMLETPMTMPTIPMPEFMK